MDITNRQKGFSLMEVLLVIAIMGIMAIVITPRYLASKKIKAMSFARTQIVNDMRYAQDSTLSGMKFPGDTIPPKGGFGISLRTGSNSFVIFGDRDQDKLYNGGSDGILETVALENGIYISRLEQCNNKMCSGASNVLTTVDYVCVPPYGTSYINNITSGEVVIRVTLSSSDDTIQSSFVISSSGYTSYTS